MSQTIQHQQISPVTDSIYADHGIAYLKYQQALIFVFEDLGVFNALTVLTILPSIFRRIDSDSNWIQSVCIPNVNGRPIRIKANKLHLIERHAFNVYEHACIVYEKAEQEVQANLLEVFDSSIEDQIEDLNA